MRTTGLLLQLFFIAVFSVICYGEKTLTGSATGQDLYINAEKLVSYTDKSNTVIVCFEGNVSVSAGNSYYHCRKMVARITPVSTVYLGKSYNSYKTMLFLEEIDKTPGEKHIANINIYSKKVYQNSAVVLGFSVTGEIYASANKQAEDNVTSWPLYQKANAVFKTMTKQQLLTTVQPGAEIPKIDKIISPGKIRLVRTEKKSEITRDLPRDDSLAYQKLPKKPNFRYPVNIASATTEAVKFDSEEITTDDGLTAVAITGRFYLWQKMDKSGALLELTADDAVIYYASGQFKKADGPGFAGTGGIKAIYLRGNVIMAEGSRQFKAEQMYYDFDIRTAVAIKASIKSFDTKRAIPIYIRADKIRQIAENKFTAENVTVTNSEFVQPQVWLAAEKIALTDTTAAEQTNGKEKDSSYLLEMDNIKLLYNDVPFFYWPKIKTNLNSPDTPIKSVHISDDSDFGFSVETRWHLFQLLGIREPNNVDATFAFDIYGQRGLGTGVDIDYHGKDYYGKVLGYLISDRGSDDLGRTRKDIEPDDDLRGRFKIQHRQYLQDNWQLTFESSYSSDKNFIEAFYRNEFNTGKEQETIVHLKRSWQNQGLSVLAKVRINDFVDKLEELPTAQYHIAGESVLNDEFTFFGDAQISRYRQRYEDGSANAIDPTLSERFFSFGYSRAELDWPLTYQRAKFIPYAAVTAAFDDGDGFNTNLGPEAVNGENDVLLSEAGLRASKTYWKVYPEIKSRFWNVNGIRHIVKPHFEAAVFAESDSQVKQRDIFNVGLSQRWQTKRLAEGKYQSVDWMRLMVDATFVSDEDDAVNSPDKYIWNRPFEPMVFRRNSDAYGLRRNKINADYYFQLSDTTAVMSDLNYDIKAGTVGQFNIGLSHYRYPDLSYYIGSRYLRDVEVLDEKGSSALLYAITYKISPKYTMLFSQEYNFDYGSSLESELTIIRKYQRVYWAITLNVDSSLDRSGILFSIWPEGVRELAIGSRKFFGLTGTSSSY